VYLEGEIMNTDQVAGAAKQAAGAVKETVGKALGDKKLETKGKIEKIAGKVRSAVGDAKDALKK